MKMNRIWYLIVMLGMIFGPVLFAGWVSLPEQFLGPDFGERMGLFNGEGEMVGEEDGPVGKLHREYFWDGYIVRFYLDKADDGFDLGGSFEIKKDGEILYQRSGGIFYLKEFGADKEEESAWKYFGEDLTGDGRPNLAIWQFSNGMHCCSSFYLFEVGAEFRFLTEVYGRECEVEFEDRDGDGIPEISVGDDTFVYWRYSYGDSPRVPHIVLRWEGDEYLMALDLMYRPPLPREELETRVRSIWREDMWRHSSSGWDRQSDSLSLLPLPFGDGIDLSRYHEPPSEVWGVMLRLIYTGNWQEAWDFYDLACSDLLRWKEECAQDFRQRLTTSPYWPDIKEMNDI